MFGSDKKKEAGYLFRQGVPAASPRRTARSPRATRSCASARTSIPSEYACEMKNSANAVEFDDLHTCFFTDTGVVKSRRRRHLRGAVGKTVGRGSASPGCGKGPSRASHSSSSCSARRARSPAARFASTSADHRHRRDPRPPRRPCKKIRGSEVSMIYQEPMTSLNPVFKVGEQIEEVIALHDGKDWSPEQIKARRDRDDRGPSASPTPRASTGCTRMSSPAACASAS